MKYRKKPVVIDAFQLNARGLVEEDWFWDAVSRNDIITYHFGKFHPQDAYCDIKTLEGTMRANTGDYIIRGVNGEIYPCKADIFEKTYELAESEERGMETMLKPSYSSMKFEAKGLLERGEIYVCDNLRDVVIQVILKDVANNDIEPHINILKSIVTDYINRQSRK